MSFEALFLNKFNAGCFRFILTTQLIYHWFIVTECSTISDYFRLFSTSFVTWELSKKNITFELLISECGEKDGMTKMKF